MAEQRGDAADPAPGGDAVTPTSGDGGANCVSLTAASGHINFFQELERGERTGGENEERSKELKEEREKYEKSIGYLTYLGQGSREETKQKAWFESLPVDRAKDRRENTAAEEIKKRAKDFEDPLKVVHRLVGDVKSPPEASRSLPLQKAASCPTRSPISTKIGIEDKHRPSVSKRRARSPRSSDESSGGSGSGRRRRSSSSRRKRHKVERERKSEKKAKKKRRKKSEDEKHSRKSSKKSRRKSPSPSDGSPSAEDFEDAETAEVRRIQLERLRAERLQRERAERERAERLLRQLRGEEPRERRDSPPPLKPKYNNQFNPHLAKQNYRHK